MAFPYDLVARLIRALGDPERKSITIIDQLERFTHDQRAFVTEVELSIAAGQSAYTIATIGDRNICMKTRLVQSISSAAVDVKTELYEDVASSGTPTVIPVFNLNRNSVSTSVFSHVSGEIATGGTKLPFTQRLYSENKAANSISENTEYVMKKNVKYALKVTNNGTQTATIILRWYFYECSE